jgi:hypothetical protein
MAQKKSSPAVSIYPHIEAVLDSRGFDRVKKAFDGSRGRLSALGKGKAKTEGEKAVKAFDLAEDLIEYLFSLKDQLENPAAQKR